MDNDALKALPTLTSRVTKVVQSVGAYIRQELSQLSVSQVQVKDLNSLVSYVDITAEKTLVTELNRLLPEAGFVTEEGTARDMFPETDVKHVEWYWVIDPLDGTTNFIHGLPFFSTSIGLKLHNEYVLGVVYDIMHDRMYAASIGQGATVNGKQIRVSKTLRLADSLLATGFPYQVFDHMESYLELFRELFQSTRGIRRLGSAALDLAYIAQGSFTGFYEYGLNEWDVAGGLVIVQEAGGLVTDFDSQPFQPGTRTLLATNGLIHQELQGHVSRCFGL